MSFELTKIHHPKIRRAYPRQRVFSVLDAAAQRPMAWISANAGAGKTVLLASYLEARNVPDLWYQMDARDTDPATFFYYLREAACQIGLSHAEALPLLTPDYAGAEKMFARDFFAHLFADVEHPFAMVFDNYQDIADDSLLHILLSEALQEISPGIRVFVLSRSEPPAVMARWRANRRMTLIDANVLRLDRSETAGILELQSESALDSALIDAIYKDTDGWAAGVTILHEHIKQPSTTAGQLENASREAMFRYFAGEIYKNLSVDMREFLILTAIAPQFDIEMARALVNLGNVDKQLNGLLRRNLFIYEHAERQHSYQYHPLFREFLLDISRCESVEAHHARMRSVAKVLLNAGQLEDAVDLYLEISDWAAVTEVISGEARLLYEQGRLRQLNYWIESIPELIRLNNPWLDYWFAMCRMGYDFYTAREAFIRVSGAFKQEPNLLGRCLAAVGIVDTFNYEQGDFHSMDPWIDELDFLLRQHAEDLPGEVVARITVALFIAMLYRRGEDPQLPALSQQVFQIIERVPNDLLRLIAGSFLLFYLMWWQGDMAKADSLVGLLKSSAQNMHRSPFTQITWFAIQSTYAWMSADMAYCLESVEQGLLIADQSGVHLWDFMLLAQAGMSSLTSDDLSRAHYYLERMASAVQAGRLVDQTQYHYILFIEALHRDDLAAMCAHAYASLQFAGKTGGDWAAGTVLPACARAEAANGNIDKAMNVLDQAHDLANRLRSNTIYHSELLTRLELALPRDNRDAILREYMRVSRESGFVNAPMWRKTVMSKIFSRALVMNIEPQFAQDVIKLRGLLPDEEDPSCDWPWPVRIYTLGRFSLVLRDKPVTFAGKVQKRTLELIKAMISLGSRDINEKQLMTILWPENDDEKAKQNLKSAVYRLRKLLGPGILYWQQGKLSLDEKECWVDVVVVSRLVNKLFQSFPSDSQQLQRDLQQLCELYKGGFLQSEEAAYALGLREHLRQRILYVLKQAAEYLLRKGEYEVAMNIYQKGLEVEPLEEVFYRGMMLSQQAQGHITQALTIFEHYRAVLHNSLNLEPSRELSEFAASLRSQNI